MAKFNPDRDVTETLAAGRTWFMGCMVDDGSVFSEEGLWSIGNIEELIAVFVNQPDTGRGSFENRLEQQMQTASPAARRLMAEMLWVILLFQTRTTPKMKRDEILRVWDWSGTNLNATHPFLSDQLLDGIGFPGPGYNFKRPQELAYLIEIARSFKGLHHSRRQDLANDPWAFGSWLDGVHKDGERQFRHILCYLVFPDTFERMTFAEEKRDALAGLTQQSHSELDELGDLELDRRLADLRRQIATDRGSNDFDFYQPDLKARWKKTGAWLLCWNPANWPWKDFQANRLQIANGQSLRVDWTCRSKDPVVGDTVYLVRVGTEPKGIIARGKVLKPSYLRPHYDPKKREQAGIFNR